MYIIFNLIIYFDPILADLAIDQGASWSYISERLEGCTNAENELCRLFTWISLGDDSYRMGNYIEAIERYRNSLALIDEPDSRSEYSYQGIIKNHIGDSFFKWVGMKKL